MKELNSFSVLWLEDEFNSLIIFECCIEMLLLSDAIINIKYTKK